jgi:dihydrodipicolinate synthase/N-acetylneuraminate lyase
MKTTPVTPADLRRSVIAVPPLARHADFTLNREANTALIRHLEAGGISSLMYGGNANFYHLPLSEYAATVDVLAGAAAPDTWVLPSVGPDYGKLIDQASVLKSRRFPTAMLLPYSGPMTDDGFAIGVRRFTDAFGKPAVIYIKNDGYVAPSVLGALQREGRVVAVKYAVVCDEPQTDPYLDALLGELPREIVVSGIGERPAVVHLRDFGLTSFTTGSGCVAPRRSMEILKLLHEQRWDAAERVRALFMPLEDQRDAINPIRVLHDAVTLAGIADMGPMLPLLTGLSDTDRDAVAPVARALIASNA